LMLDLVQQSTELDNTFLAYKCKLDVEIWSIISAQLLRFYQKHEP